MDPNREKLRIKFSEFSNFYFSNNYNIKNFCMYVYTLLLLFIYHLLRTNMYPHVLYTHYMLIHCSAWTCLTHVRTYVQTTITHTYTTTQTHAYGSIYFDNILIYFYHHRTLSILDSLHSIQSSIGFSHMHVIVFTYSKLICGMTR